jgi:hypothetical protein
MSVGAAALNETLFSSQPNMDKLTAIPDLFFMEKEYIVHGRPEFFSSNGMKGE